MIKIINLIVLKPDSRVNRDKVHVTGQEGQRGLTQYNAWIKVVIIIVSKPDSGVDLK